MTLETLFARQGQCAAFLQLCVLGLAAGALLHLSVAVHRRRRWLGMALDVVCCLAVAAAAALVPLRYGGGVRLYGLLGLAVGALLYMAGVMQLLRLPAWLAARRKNAARPRRHPR